MKTKLIYESKRPKFAILVDDMQWILAKKLKQITDKQYIPNSDWCVTRKSETGDVFYRWVDTSYFSNMQAVLDHLCEWAFRRYAHKVGELSELGDAVLKTYKLIDRVAGKLDVKGHGKN